MINLIRYIAIIALIITASAVYSQQPPTTQDCKGAIPVCDYIYIEETTATGYGNYYEIPNGGNNCPNNHCMDGEHNSRWYILTVIESGNLSFQITPQVQTDDYDWAVFDLTENTCDDVYNNIGAILSSCNAAGGPGYQGTTGISSLNGGSTNCNNGGPTNKWNADLPVFEGETYVLIVSDWTQTPGGYTLDFSSSTAVILDDQNPYIEYIGGDLITSCATNELNIKFNENVICSSIQPSDFELTGPGGPFTIDSIFGETCDLGGDNEREYTLYITPGFYQGGDFNLSIKQFSFISDACNNYAYNDTYDFSIDLESPIADAGEDIDIPYGGSASLEGSATNGSGNYNFYWVPEEMLLDPSVYNPQTINLTTSTEFVLTVSDLVSACIGEDTVMVNVVGGPLGVNIGINSNEICNGERVDLMAMPDGGSGNYSYSWTSNPEGFTSSAQSPSDFPTDNIWYILHVTDGFTDIYDSTFVVVNPLPISDAGPDQVINEGTSTTLSGSGSGGTGNLNYLWEPSNLLESNNVSNPQTFPLYEPTVFSLWVTDEKNCVSNPDNVIINASGGGLAAFPYSDSLDICIGQSTTVYSNATGGGGEYSYNWTSDPPGFYSSEPFFSDAPETTTIYNLLLTDQFDNEFEANITITVHPLPVVDLVPENANTIGADSIIVCVRDTVLMDAGFDSDPPNTEYFWIENNVLSRYYTASTNGSWIDIQKHSARVTNGATGCINNGELTIVFDFDECSIGTPEYNDDKEKLFKIIPNPNNGTFLIITIRKLTNLQINIHNNLGQVVYHEKVLGQVTVGSSFSFSDLTNGTYSITVNCDSGTDKQMVIVQ